MAGAAILDFETVNISGLDEDITTKLGGHMHHGRMAGYSDNIINKCKMVFSLYT